MTWECFYDKSYYGMWAVRHIGRTSFGEAVHVGTQEEAEFLVEALNERDRLVEALKYAWNKLYTLEKAPKSEISPEYMVEVKKAWVEVKNTLKELGIGEE